MLSVPVVVLWTAMTVDVLGVAGSQGCDDTVEQVGLVDLPVNPAYRRGHRWRLPLRGTSQWRDGARGGGRGCR